jgi:hypothetical protein
VGKAQLKACRFFCVQPDVNTEQRKLFCALNQGASEQKWKKIPAAGNKTCPIISLEERVFQFLE